MSIMQMITVTNMQIHWFLRNLQLIGLVLKGLATRSLQVGGPYRQTGGKGPRALKGQGCNNQIWRTQLLRRSDLHPFHLTPEYIIVNTWSKDRGPKAKSKLYNVSEKHFGQGSWALNMRWNNAWYGSLGLKRHLCTLFWCRFLLFVSFFFK
jgi:hypothetical protein